MRKAISPLLQNRRSAVLLDGSAHTEAVQALKQGKEIKFESQDLKLLSLPRSDSWGIDDSINLIIHVPELLLRCENEKMTRTIVIDVSPGTSSRVLEKDHLVYEFIEQKIQKLYVNLRSISKNIIFTSDLDSSFLGWILEYPVVYYSNSENGNSLSNEILILFLLFEPDKSESFTSFSVPEQIVNDPRIKSTLELASQKWVNHGVSWRQKKICLPAVAL